MHVTCVGELLVVLAQPVAEPLESTVSFTRSLGGSEFNTAVALAASGTSVGMVSVVGDDGFGRYASANVASHSIETSGIVVDDERPTGLYVKELGAVGVSRMHYFRAASAGSLLSPAIIRRPDIELLLSTTRVIHTTGITAALSASSLAALSLIVEERGDRLLSFDVSWRPSLWRDREDEATEVLGAFVGQSDVAFATRADACEAFGTGEPDALRSLFPEPRWLFVSDKQSITAFDGRRRNVIARTTSPAVDAIGASDAFSGGVLAALLRGASVADAAVAGDELATRVSASTSDHLLSSS
ncbi:sugar kinase [Paramicrobacterium agarici]|uniref:sugar kinase n=1 Tax=Paramicrobacterium agarici TaxID=630514 RepID=UPI0014751D77|nr:sugar kinase [Microbacterium agarici]